MAQNRGQQGELSAGKEMQQKRQSKERLAEYIASRCIQEYEDRGTEQRSVLVVNDNHFFVLTQKGWIGFKMGWVFNIPGKEKRYALVDVYIGEVANDTTTWATHPHGVTMQILGEVLDALRIYAAELGLNDLKRETSPAPTE